SMTMIFSAIYPPVFVLSVAPAKAGAAGILAQHRLMPTTTPAFAGATRILAIALMKKEPPFDKLRENGIGKRAIILQNCATHAICCAAQHGGTSRRNHRQRDFPARNRRGTSRTSALSPEAPFHAGRFEPAAVRRPFGPNGCACASPYVSIL
ncbi:MAG: hypothetical protein ACT6RK_19700, partial [Sphingopyxis sp.]|uniref:hypothetical protein n=1 Tax=Sphingopyxis sp. TaxID=1908224 RepID=UPI004035F834